ncbi:MAG: cell division protein FtsZ [Anaerolineae bacterium]
MIGDVNPVSITVVGVGGAGCNAVDRMISVDIPGVKYIVLNTDGQAISQSAAPVKITLGGPRTRGLGAGGDPTRGAEATKLSSDQIAKALEGTDLVFIAAGMGGGTGSGSAPVVGDIARSLGALAVAVVTKPFSFEGYRRRQVAEDSLAELKQHVDTLICVPNDRLLSFTSDRVTLDVAFRIADDVLRQGIQGISEVITRPGLINVDFADVRRIMSLGGTSMMSIATAKGPERALEAAQSAITNPLVDTESIGGATGILVNVVGGPDMTLHEAGRAVEHITERANPDADVIFGAAIDNAMGEKLQITLIATGIQSESARQTRPVATAPAVRTRKPEPSPDRNERAAISVPRDFEQRLDQVRGRRETVAPQPARQPVPEPVMSSAQAVSAGSLDIPTFLRRVRGSL